MKYYKDENNQIYSYEDDLPEFGSYTEVEQEVPLEEGDEHYGEEGYEDATKIIIIQIPNSPTVKEGLVLITEDDATTILEEQSKPTQEDVISNNIATITFSINECNNIITKLEDNLKFSITNNESNDVVLLENYKKLRTLLHSVDTSVENMKLPTLEDASSANLKYNDRYTMVTKHYVDEKISNIPSSGVDSSQMLGIGQVWHNLTRSRRIGNEYTNVNKKPIIVSVSADHTSNEKLVLGLYVNNILVSTFGSNISGVATTGQCLVPINTKYSVIPIVGTAISFAYNWAELS